MRISIIYILMLVGRSVKTKPGGSKIDYQTESTASEAANRMNSKPNTRNILEAYSCAFCQGWHIGRAMIREELESYIEQ